MMKRRELLQSVTAALAAAPAAANAVIGQASSIESEPALILRTRIAGHHYHHGPALLDQLRIGDGLELVREPANEYDPDAIRTDWHGQKLGYLPRHHNYAVARLLERRQCLSARICELDPRNDPWRPVGVDVLLRLPVT